MKATMKRQVLAEAFAFVSKIATKTGARDELQRVKLVVGESGFSLSASNGDVAARWDAAPGDGFRVDRSGEAIVPAKWTRRIFAEATGETVALETVEKTLAEKTLVVESGNGRFKLATGTSENVPNVEKFARTTFFRIAGNDLKDAIRRGAFAVDESNANYALGGALFEPDGDRITVVSTDGRRMATQTTQAEPVGTRDGENDSNVGAIVPAFALRAIENAANGCDVVSLAFDGQKAFVQANEKTLVCSLLERRYPDWKKIVPDKSRKVRVEFVAGVLTSAVRQAALVASDKAPGVLFQFGAGNVVFSACGEERGESNVRIPIVYDGADAAIRFQPSYLLDFLQRVDQSANVAFYFEPGAPALFETNDGGRYVVMPLD